MAETLTHFLWECSATRSEAVHDLVDGISDGYMPDDVLNDSEAMTQWAFSKHGPRGLMCELDYVSLEGIQFSSFGFFSRSRVVVFLV
ncbi:MAG: hypothetical protein GY696_39585 [Gammaproteobacteria bacterium]|nr:hypothetical protein [Gammaproteobacteria bacterium]